KRPRLCHFVHLDLALKMRVAQAPHRGETTMRRRLLTIVLGVALIVPHNKTSSSSTPQTCTKPSGSLTPVSTSIPMARRIPFRLAAQPCHGLRCGHDGYVLEPGEVAELPSRDSGKELIEPV